jgi:hypothetical protein
VWRKVEGCQTKKGWEDDLLRTFSSSWKEVRSAHRSRTEWGKEDRIFECLNECEWGKEKKKKEKIKLLTIPDLSRTATKGEKRNGGYRAAHVRSGKTGQLIC